MESDIKVNEYFTSQFQAYQEQQQQRLQSLMERKKENQSSDNGNAKETFRIPDLDLFETEEVCEGDSKRLLEAENKLLQDQLQVAQDENCRLNKLVTEKEFEIKQLQKKVQDRLAVSGASGLAGDVAATKIVELAKKNREITAETESERAKVKQLSNRVKELERELQTAMEKVLSCGGDGEIKQSAVKLAEGNLAESAEVKALQEKVTAANFKVIEYRNLLQSAKQELKMTQKLLANEVGEDVNIQSLLSNSGSWRGRAQQILVLQGKVRELESQLAQNKSRTSLSELDVDLLALSDPRKLSPQEKNLLKIRSLEKEKKEALERLTGEHDALQKSHEEVKNKLEASKARNKVLCSEVKTLKGQIITLLEKGKHDDELIDTLLSQQKQMQEILQRLSQQDEKYKEPQQMLSPHFNNELQRSECLIEQLRQALVEREAKVKELEEEIAQLTLQREPAHQWNCPGAADPPSPEHSEDPGFTLHSPLASDSSQGGRIGSARKVSKMGHTLVESAATQPSALGSNFTPGRLSGTGSQDLKVLQMQIVEQEAFCQAAEVERDKLLELVSVLQKRVEEGSDQLLEAEKRLQEEQQRRVIVERQLETLQGDPGRNTSGQKPQLRSKAVAVWLVTQLEENKVLRAALETTVRKKKEDFKLWQGTMDRVKDIFLQAIWQQKQEKS
ncbi:LOW QUALITY PROTEIN: coiled-coil domain-containing protein 13 [Dryobates pubescens]|uniref:LOW QUALITY PROTEIN: coiled-coil domain-containing protein 13 n=1 Tax=Dryobates pubescens TaxID=118200 RepID=UPI0023B96D20|nr:LOW QUALITY PROTEIN: coiled-coil domain-containing protein 13 [Dryobates pubescens]